MVQIFVEKANILYLNSILSAYRKLLIKEEFFSFLTHQNNEGLTVFEQSIDLPISYDLYTQIIELLYNYVSDNNTIFYNLCLNRISNIFHISARENKFYPLIFYYERIIDMFPSSNPFDIPDKYNRTPLHYACYYSHKKFAEILIDFGCQINVTDVHNNTPLHLAVLSGNHALVKKLIINGANKNIVNDKNKKPIDLAKENNNFLLIDLLSDKGLFSFKAIQSIKNQEKDSILLISFFFVLFFKVGFSYLLYETRGITTVTWLFWLMITSIPFDVGVICSVFWFRKYALRCYRKKKEKEKKKIFLNELIKDEKVDNIDNICVVCRIIKPKYTQHCLICKECVNEWDHHCYWLNRCINVSNRKYFLLFISFLFSSIISITIIFILLLYLLWSASEQFDLYKNVLYIDNTNTIILIKIIMSLVIVVSLFYISFGLACVIGQLISYLSCKEDNNNNNKYQKSEKSVQLVEV